MTSDLTTKRGGVGELVFSQKGCLLAALFVCFLTSLTNPKVWNELWCHVSMWPTVSQGSRALVGWLKSHEHGLKWISIVVFQLQFIGIAIQTRKSWKDNEPPGTAPINTWLVFLASVFSIFWGIAEDGEFRVYSRYISVMVFALTLVQYRVPKFPLWVPFAILWAASDFVFGLMEFGRGKAFFVEHMVVFREAAYWSFLAAATVGMMAQCDKLRGQGKGKGPMSLTPMIAVAVILGYAFGILHGLAADLPHLWLMFSIGLITRAYVLCLHWHEYSQLDEAETSVIGFLMIGLRRKEEAYTPDFMI